MPVSFILWHDSLTIRQEQLIHHAGLSDENVCLSHILNNTEENEGQVQGAFYLDLIHVHTLSGSGRHGSSHTPEETAHMVKYSCVPGTPLSPLLPCNWLTK